MSVHGCQQQGCHGLLPSLDVTQLLPVCKQWQLVMNLGVAPASSIQATQVDDGTMLNPAKFARTAACGGRNYMKFPTPYYGTVDATILWIITLAEAYRWNADSNMLDQPAH